MAEGGQWFPTWRYPWGLRSGSSTPMYPLPNRPEKPAQLSGWVLCSQRHPPHPGLCGSWGQKREAREIRRSRQEGPSRTEEQERRGGCWPCSLKPGKPTELPGQSPTLQSLLHATWDLGIGGRLQGRSGEAGRRGLQDPELEGERSRGLWPQPLELRETY